jgi:hypothetical protein
VCYVHNEDINVTHYFFIIFYCENGAESQFHKITYFFLLQYLVNILVKLRGNMDPGYLKNWNDFNGWNIHSISGRSSLHSNTSQGEVLDGPDCNDHGSRQKIESRISKRACKRIRRLIRRELEMDEQGRSTGDTVNASVIVPSRKRRKTTRTSPAISNLKDFSDNCHKQNDPSIPFTCPYQAILNGRKDSQINMAAELPK